MKTRVRNIWVEIASCRAGCLELAIVTVSPDTRFVFKLPNVATYAICGRHIIRMQRI